MQICKWYKINYLGIGNIMNTEKLLTLCKKYQYIYIYGAGKNARQIYEFLSDRGIMPCGFLVSDKLDNPGELYNIPVIRISKFISKEKYLILTSAQRKSEIYKEVLDCLVESRVQNVVVLTDSIISDIKRVNSEKYINNKLQEKFVSNGYHIVDNVSVELGHRVFAMVDKEKNYYHWRFHQNLCDKEDVKSIDLFFEHQTALEEFEYQYGKYYIFKSLNLNKRSTLAQKIYKVYMTKCHVDKEVNIPALPEWIEPIQVGAALTDKRISELTDHTGDNISNRNGIYSECTAIYWMWKNAPKTDYIGLCHYRRHFDIPQDNLNTIETSDIDVLVTTPTFVFEGVEKFLLSYVPKSDFMVFKNAIKNIHPEYMETAEKFLNSRFYPPCNLFIMKYELFQEYAEFVFSVTFEIERFYNERGFIRQDRYMGYLIECLLGIFLMKHKEALKIAYTDMKFYE